ncbi:hypothetical protein ElyMa_003213100 [Elysia marginata]|uniref:Uncharacterized protein n=1 Tax=Elysia marginata TaxID=1093978 RepID=A0AAV4J274_9GAST|nr:hypothetical protein ElyMa_003213100 [Elysia marginata]
MLRVCVFPGLNDLRSAHIRVSGLAFNGLVLRGVSKKTDVPVSSQAQIKIEKLFMFHHYHVASSNRLPRQEGTTVARVKNGKGGLRSSKELTYVHAAGAQSVIPPSHDSLNSHT